MASIECDLTVLISPIKIFQGGKILAFSLVLRDIIYLFRSGLYSREHLNYVCDGWREMWTDSNKNRIRFLILNFLDYHQLGMQKIFRSYSDSLSIPFKDNLVMIPKHSICIMHALPRLIENYRLSANSNIKLISFQVELSVFMDVSIIHLCSSVFLAGITNLSYAYVVLRILVWWLLVNYGISILTLRTGK